MHFSSVHVLGHLFLYICMFVYAHMHVVSVCGGQRLTSAVLLNHSPTYFLRQRLSLELTDSLTWASQPAPGALCLQQTCGALLSSVSHMGSGDLNLGPYARRASPLPTKAISSAPLFVTSVVE